MRLKLRFFYFLLLSLLFKCSATVPVQAVSEFVEESLRVRVRRQDGYVYDKPSVSFDLPQSRSTPAPTQAPNVDRTLTQQMFYAYPVPAGGDTVNIGQTAGTTTTAATATPAEAAGGGYSDRSADTGSASAGYNYGTSSTGAQANTGSQVTTGSQATVTNTQIGYNTGLSQGGSGYPSNAPSPTLSPTLQGSSEVSTSAPKYLPPTASGTGGGTSTGGVVSIGGVSVTSGSGQISTGTDTSMQTGSVRTPSESYLPPLGTSNTATSGRTVTPISTNSQTSTGGSVSVPSSAYLPPNTSPSQPSPVPSPGYGSSQPAAGPAPSPAPAPAPQPGYIPPSGTNSGTVSTPASTYLPPSFF